MEAFSLALAYASSGLGIPSLPEGSALDLIAAFFRPQRQDQEGVFGSEQKPT